MKSGRQEDLPEHADVLIAGGGVVGLALATALKQAMGSALTVELWDPALGQRAPRQRVSALAAGSRRMLELFGAWREIEDGAQPIRRMEITDSRLEDRVRPILLRFEGEPSPGEPFAHMVSNSDLEAALHERAVAAGAILRPDAAELVDIRGPVLRGAISGRRLRPHVLVAADGANSPLREAAPIDSVSWAYRAKAIVRTIAHERDHGGCARQHFLPEGPLAVLPLPGLQSSIVWSLPARRAEEVAALSDAAFLDQLEARAGLELGRLEAVDAPLSFDLRFRLARRFVVNRLVLVGDAAHLIHPLAGQGLNLGLRDVAALAETIVDSARLGLDPGVPGALRAYERARRFDAAAMAAATDALSRIFLAEGAMRPVRDWGLGAVNRLGWFKRMLIEEAAGLAASAPKLLLGESL